MATILANAISRTREQFFNLEFSGSFRGLQWESDDVLRELWGSLYTLDCNTSLSWQEVKQEAVSAFTKANDELEKIYKKSNIKTTVIVNVALGVLLPSLAAETINDCYKIKKFFETMKELEQKLKDTPTELFDPEYIDDPNIGINRPRPG